METYSDNKIKKSCIKCNFEIDNSDYRESNLCLWCERKELEEKKCVVSKYNYFITGWHNRLKHICKYKHIDQENAPKTSIKSKDFHMIYKKLKNFLAISIEQHCPVRQNVIKRPIRYLFIDATGYNFHVIWMPVLQKGYSRLSFGHMMEWYGIK